MDTMPVPELSVVIVVCGDEESLRRTLAGLLEQETELPLEIVLVGLPASGAAVYEAQATPLIRIQVVDVEPAMTRSERRACGVRHAAAPVVAFLEDHACPESGWAKALIDAHRRPWAAVGYRIENANPDSLTSWVNLFLHYGPWVEYAKRGEIAALPSENISYKRDALLEYGEKLSALLENDYTLHVDMIAKGGRLFLEPAARIRHRNISSFRASIVENYSNGVIFAGARCDAWPVSRRIIYAGGSLLIPFIRLPRVLKEIRRTGRSGLAPKLVPLLMINLLWGALGEMAGYAGGAERSRR